MIDPLALQLLAHISRNGFTVTTESTDAGHQFTAQASDGSARHVVRGEDEYAMACRLAALCGIDLIE